MAAADTDDALELSLVNDLRNVAAVAAENVGAFRAEHGMAKQIAFEVNLATDEPVTNTIGYGYDDDGEHRIELVLRLEGGALMIGIADDGRAFDPLPVPEPDLSAPLEDRAKGGLGIYPVRKTMDGVACRPQDGRNMVTPTKRVAPAQAE